MKGKLILMLFLAIFLAGAVSAVSVYDMSQGTLTPGRESSLSVTLKNDLSYDIEDVSLALTLPKGLSAVGSSIDTATDINEDKKEDFGFTIKASSDTKPGDYTVPYKITFYNADNRSIVQTPVEGTLTISVSGNPELVYTVSTDNPVVGSKAKLTIKIVNKGVADAKFLTLKLNSDSFTLLSEDEVYIGTVASDDFETATFDVIYKQSNPEITFDVSYKDFDNNAKSSIQNIPLTVYTQEKALQLGIIKKSNTTLYVIIVIVLLVLWFIWRAIKKRRRLKRSMQKEE